VSESVFIWCLHCERAYHRDKARGGNCAYDDCDGSVSFDGWNWNDIREGREDRYPASPEWGKVYSQYDD